MELSQIGNKRVSYVVIELYHVILKPLEVSQSGFTTTTSTIVNFKLSNVL